MTVSHLTRTRNQLWSDLVGALDGSGSNLTLSEEELIAAARNTYGGSISAKTTSRADLIASLVNAAGGSVSASTHSEEEMIAALANALGGSVSALSGSVNANLAASVNAAAEGEGGETVPEGAVAYVNFVSGFAYAGGSEKTLAQVLSSTASVTEEGLSYIPGELQNAPSPAGDFATTILSCDWRIVIDFSIPENFDPGTLMFFALNSVDEQDILYVSLYGSPDSYLEISDWVDGGGEQFRSAYVDANGTLAGTHQIEVTRDDDSITAKLDAGITATDDNTSFSLTPTVAAFFAGADLSTSRELHIQKITVYPHA